MTPPRELRIGDQVRCNVPMTSQRAFQVVEFVTLRRYVLRDGVQYAEDTPGAALVTVDQPVRRTSVRLDRIHLDGEARKADWSLVVEGGITFIEEDGGGQGVRSTPALQHPRSAPATSSPRYSVLRKQKNGVG